jgi:acyl dehydratase
MRIFTGLDELAAAAGRHLGHSEWLAVGQERVDAFAAATGDHQWIHVDPERAAAGPYGATIAHGFLMLSLLPTLAAQIYRVDGVGRAINYGLDRVRFPAPLPTGSTVRAGLTIAAVDPVAGGVQLATDVTLERAGGEKPCCVARTLSRLYV